MRPRIPVREYRLKNGLLLLVSERHSHPVVCSMIWYRVGSRNEGQGETGLSHFLEHMLFKGTPRHPKGSIDRITARLGGSNNAFTNTDYTAYYFHFASDRWLASLDIEADRMRRCLLDPKEFEAEKQVVLEELKQGKDDPWRDLYQEMQTAAYLVHPYHHPVIGWEEELLRLSRERMARYYARHYAPDNAVIVVAGDVGPAAVVRAVRRRFERIPLPKREPAPPILPEPEQRGERRITLRRATNLRRFAVAYKTCRVGEAEDYALDVISTLLSFGKSARFYRKLVRPGVATHATTENDPRIDPGLFWAGAELAQDASAERAERTILRELEEVLPSEPVSARELRKAKRILRSSFAFQQETIGDLAERLGRLAVQASHRDVNRYVAEIERVDARRICETARQFFRRENRTVGWAVPKGKVR